MHATLQGQIFDFKGSCVQDFDKAKILKLLVNGNELVFCEVKYGAKIFGGIVATRATKVQTIDVHLDLFILKVWQMLVDKKVVNEGESFHQKVA